MLHGRALLGFMDNEMMWPTVLVIIIPIYHFKLVFDFVPTW